MRAIVLSLQAAAASLLFTLPAFAAERVAANTWEALAATPKTQKVTVVLKDGKTLSGYIQETQPAGLTFVRKKQVITVQRDDIQRVTKTSRLKGAMWGAIVGGGIGAAVGAGKAGYIVDKNNPSTNDRFAVAGYFGGFFGGIGAALGAGIGYPITLYRAEKLSGAVDKPSPQPSGSVESSAPARWSY